MSKIYLLDCLFLCRAPVRSLPAWHGARWSAWLRFAAASQGIRLEDVVAGVLPLQSGTRPLLPGCMPVLRLAVPAEGFSHVPALLRAMVDLEPRGEFSSLSLLPVRISDAVGGASGPAETGLEMDACTALSTDSLGEETVALKGLSSWRLCLCGPLRLTLPAGMKHTGMHGVERLCRPEFFQEDPRAVAHLLAGVRDGQKKECGDGLRPSMVELRWEDMRYSRERQIALGGIVGEMRFDKAPGNIEAERLVLGQYLGAGKNARFGLGYWRIPELDAVRRIGAGTGGTHACTR